MALVSLSIDSIGDLNHGAARLLIQREIDRAVADLDDRGDEDGKPRKVVIQVELTRDKDFIVATVAAEAKLPPRRTGGTSAEIRAKDGVSILNFRDDNDERVDQPTLRDHGA